MIIPWLIRNKEKGKWYLWQQAVLVGPSGCGKTTTLRMIAGLEEVTQGEIYIGDRLVNNLPPKDRNIAMVFQSYALYPHMKVSENMAFGLKMRRVPKQERDLANHRASEPAGHGERGALHLHDCLE